MTAAELIAEARSNIEHLARGIPGSMADRVRTGEADDPRVSLIVRLADALEHADRIARLHEEATENAARYSAVIVGIRDNLTGHWTQEKSNRLDALLKADPSAVLRERLADAWFDGHTAHDFDDNPHGDTSFQRRARERRVNGEPT